MPVHFVRRMSFDLNVKKRWKDKKERKTVVYNNPSKSIFFQYLPFSTQPNQLKIAYFCASM